MINSMRRIILSCAFVATAFTLGAHRTAAMGVQAQASLSIEQVKDGLYAIMGSGGNVGVRVTSEGVILIDDKFPQNFAEIHYVTHDEPFANRHNNASWRAINLTLTSMSGDPPDSGQASVHFMEPAISAWPVNAPNATLEWVDLPGACRF